MFKKLTLIAGLLVAPSVVSAQAIPPASGGTGTTCSLSGVLTGFNALKCVGFYAGNIFNNSPGNPGLQSDGLTALGTTGSAGTGTNFTTGNPIGPLTGFTVIGIHFGNDPTFGGQASAIYTFNFGSNIITNLPLTGVYAEKRSNYLVYSTGGTCREGQNGLTCQPGTFSTVPEPSTYALMGAGLLGIFAVARRRRNAQV